MTEFERRRVQPARPVAGYVGGKRNLARRVIAVLDEIPHSGYAEPFVGMGGVFLRRPTAPPVEAINDLSQDVATLFRILQRHYQALMDMLKWQLASRAEFERLLAQDPATLTDLERAARFLYVQRLGFGGKVAGRTFGVAPTQPARFDVTRLGALLEAAHERLAGVWIECLPWQEFIRRWDREGMLFYVDPPYHGSEHYYGRGMFDRSDFEALSAALKGLRGHFVLSLNDVPEIRETFAWARVEGAETTYFVGDRPRAAAELIIRSP
jgi:DNA adenine methylase